MKACSLPGRLDRPRRCSDQSSLNATNFSSTIATVVGQLDNPGRARLNGVAPHQDDLPNLQPVAFSLEQAGAEPAGVRNNISGEAADGSSTPAQGFERILPSLMAKSSTILSTKKALRTVPGRRPLASSERTKASTSA
jgi:hypothetical protein